MKCPKCQYLGFDTGDRCKNCGYDFSLMATATPDPVADLTLQTDGEDLLGGNLAGRDWLDDLDTVLQDKNGADAAPLSLTPDLVLPPLTPTDLTSLVSATPEPAPQVVDEPEPLDEPDPIDEPISAPVVAAVAPAPTLSVVSPSAPVVAAAAAPALSVAAAALEFEPPMPPPSFRGEAALPLFSGDPAKDDEPLLKVPSAPRPPLAVRRTPDTPRLRAVPRLVERPVPEPEPELDFAQDTPIAGVATAVATRRSDPRVLSSLDTTAAGPRAMAAAIDHAILFAIDAVVLYLTLRIAQLTLSDIRALPLLPMATFLGLVKLAYFIAFTCVGGQTIGKMAMGIRVVGDEQRSLDAPHAIHRALAGAVSFLTLGLGFIPALFGSERRALHDRLAHTRVVTLPRA